MLKKKADSLRFNALSQNLAYRSLQVINDPSLEALLAMEAYNLANKYDNGNVQDPQIYNALLMAMKNISPSGYPEITVLPLQPLSATLVAGNQLNIFTTKGSLLQFAEPGNRLTHTHPLSASAVNDAWMSSNGHFAVTSFNDFRLQFWHRSGDKWEDSRLKKGHTDYVRTVDFSSDGKIIATGGRDKTVLIWQNDTAVRINFPSKVRALAFVANDTRLLVGCENGRVYRYYLKTRQTDTLFTYQNSRINCIAHSSDHKHIIVSSSGGKIIILNSEGEKARYIPESKSVDFISANDETGILAIATSSRQIRIMDFNEPNQKAIDINDISSPIKGICLSNEGDLYVITSNNIQNTVRKYNIRSSVLADNLSKLVKRNLTEHERKTYNLTSISQK